MERRVPEGESEANMPESELLLDLVIDSAGKVRSAESAEPSFELFLKSDVARWKFIPALSAGRAVTSRVYFLVSPTRYLCRNGFSTIRGTPPIDSRSAPRPPTTS